MTDLDRIVLDAIADLDRARDRMCIVREQMRSSAIDVHFIEVARKHCEITRDDIAREERHGVR